MKILLLSHYFPPEVNAPAVRTHTNGRLWAEAGHDVHVVTGFPSHPRGRVYPGYRRRWYSHERVDGVTVHRVWTYLASNSGFFHRSFNYLSFVPTAAWRAVRCEKFDVIVATSPQFFCAVAGFLASHAGRTPWIFELRDLWPESVAEVGAVRQGMVLRPLEWLELFLYRDAARVASVTRSFIDNLERRGIDRDKMFFVPNGVDADFLEQLDRAPEPGATRRELGLDPDQPMVSYVGTLGMAHGLEAVVDAAPRLAERGVQIVLAGDGARRGELQARASEIGATNVRFLGQLPRDKVPGLLRASDALLVSLRDSPLFRTVIPSKLLEAMAAGRPVIMNVPGEAAGILDRAAAGLRIPAGAAEPLAAAVEQLLDDPARAARMGESGRCFVEREFSREVWARRYLEHLQRVAGRP